MRKVLIIDDEQAVHQAISALIDWDAYKALPPISAYNGREALGIMEQERPEIVFVDMNMPMMDGPGFLEQASARWPGTQYIVVSGYDRFEFTRAAIRSKVLDYLLKPIDPDEITAAVNHAVSLLPPVSEEPEPSGVARSVREYIDLHYAEEISLPLLSRQFFFSREYLNRSFRAAYGCAIYEYVQKVRMEHAKKLLENRSTSLQAIAVQLGFSNANYFSKAFKKAFGVSPSEYRENRAGGPGSQGTL